MINNTSRSIEFVRSSTFRSSENLNGFSVLTCECGRQTKLMACSCWDENSRYGSVKYRSWHCPACLRILTDERPDEPFVISEQIARKEKYKGILKEIRKKK